jgi:hypothetical protein
MSFPFALWLIIGVAMVGLGLIVVALVKTVRYHGWFKHTWAPPAVPWFIAGMAVGAGALLGGVVWWMTS